MGLKRFGGAAALFLALALWVMTGTAGAAEAKGYTIAENCGNGITWTFDETTGTLTINGTGEIRDFSVVTGGNGKSGELPPWTKAQVENFTWSTEDATSVSACEKQYMLSQGRIKSVVIGEGITRVGSNVFHDCWNLTQVTLPVTLQQIGFQSFCDCKELTQIGTAAGGTNNVLPASLTSIYNSAFSGCGLTSAALPKSLTTLSENAFTGCEKLSSVTIPEDGGLTAIEDYTFDGCTALVSVTIPGNIKTIGGWAFYGSGLASVTIAEGVETIEATAFNYCDNLATLHLPASVTKISSGYAETFLHSCEKLETITVDANNTKYCAVDGILYNKDKTTLLRCPYAKTSVTTIPGSVAAIQDHAFAFGQLQTINLPAGLETIEEYAFYGCKQLTSLDLPQGIKSLESHAFSGSGLTEITIPGGCKVGSYIFLSCKSLVNVVFKEGPTDIPSGAFSNADKLQYVVIPSTVESIPYSAFNQCAALQTLYFGGTHEEWALMEFTGEDNPGKDAVNKAAVFVNSTGPGTGEKYQSPGPVYKVTFSAPDAVMYRTQVRRVIGGGTVERPKNDPYWYGNEFLGWYKEVTCANAWDFDNDTVTGDITLYAKWKAENPGPVNPTGPLVTFDLNYAGAPASIGYRTDNDGVLPTWPADPTRSGFTFDGWFTTADGGAEVQANNKFGADITLYAHWTQNGGTDPTKYTVTINLNGGTLASGATTLTVNADGTVTRPAQNPTRPGYIFVNWYTDSSCTTIWDFSTHIVTSNTTIYAKWDPDPSNPPTPPTYTVTINLNGGTLASGATTLTVNADGKVTRPAQDPTRPGYIFVNWYTDSSCTTIWDFSTHIVTSNTTIYAKWTQNGGGSNLGGDDDAHTIYLLRTSYGSISSSASRAVQGRRVTIYTYPDSNYELGSLWVTDEDGRERTLTHEGGGRYSFIMPDSWVDVEADFVRINANTSWVTPVTPVTPNTSGNQGIPIANVYGQTFRDVPTTHWAAGEIGWAYENGYMNGVGPGIFNPNGTVTHQQLWMVLARMLGSAPINMSEANRWAVEVGIAESGIPTSAVTRLKMVSALQRSAFLMGRSTEGSDCLRSYPDNHAITGPAREAMDWAVTNNIIGGTASGRLNPGGTITRAQFAVMLYRFSQRI